MPLNHDNMLRVTQLLKQFICYVFIYHSLFRAKPVSTGCLNLIFLCRQPYATRTYFFLIFLVVLPAPWSPILRGGVCAYQSVQPVQRPYYVLCTELRTPPAIFPSFVKAILYFPSTTNFHICYCLKSCS